MYGLGLTWRSDRYRSNGSASSSSSKRCDSTTWKMSPARMYSLATSTALAYRSADVRRRTSRQLVVPLRRDEQRLVERAGALRGQGVEAAAWRRRRGRRRRRVAGRLRAGSGTDSIRVTRWRQ